MTPSDLADLKYIASGIREGVDCHRYEVTEHYLEKLEALLRESDAIAEVVTTRRHEAGRVEP